MCHLLKCTQRLELILKLAEEKYFLDDRQISMLIIKR